MKQLVIVGGGFAGVWAALAARRAAPRDVEVTLVSRDGWLTIRPRLYESSLDGVRVPLADVAHEGGFARIEAEVTRIDATTRRVVLATGAQLAYDRLIVTTGSVVARPPGLDAAFTVGTYADGRALRAHLATPAVRSAPGGATAVVVGAGPMGLEVATELAGTLARVVLVERAPVLAADITRAARERVAAALAALGVEVRLGRSTAVIDREGATLDDGERIDAATVVWTGGMRAAAQSLVDAPRDPLGRLFVDAALRVQDLPGVFAAGDAAHAMADASHVAPMSCQHAIPMGECAGRNAVADLVGRPLEPYQQPHHVLCVDLGTAGALFLKGWDGALALEGFWGKQMKQTINTRLIYPPLRGDRRAA